jgi:hypothetical protein
LPINEIEPIYININQNNTISIYDIINIYLNIYKKDNYDEKICYRKFPDLATLRKKDWSIISTDSKNYITWDNDCIYIKKLIGENLNFYMY